MADLYGGSASEQARRAGDRGNPDSDLEEPSYSSSRRNSKLVYTMSRQIETSSGSDDGSDDSA